MVAISRESSSECSSCVVVVSGAIVFFEGSPPSDESAQLTVAAFTAVDLLLLDFALRADPVTGAEGVVCVLDAESLPIVVDVSEAGVFFRKRPASVDSAQLTVDTLIDLLLLGFTLGTVSAGGTIAAAFTAFFFSFSRALSLAFFSRFFSFV